MPEPNRADRWKSLAARDEHRNGDPIPLSFLAAFSLHVNHNVVLNIVSTADKETSRATELLNGQAKAQSDINKERSVNLK